MSVLTESIEMINEATFPEPLKNMSEKDNEYYNKIKKDKNWLEKILNKCSEEAIKTFKEYLSKGLDPNDKYDKNVLDDLDDFMSKNKKAPKVAKFEYLSDYIDFYYDCNGTHDMCLFYQDHVIKYIRKNQELKSKGYYFSSEDYLGINIEL